MDSRQGPGRGSSAVSIALFLGIALLALPIAGEAAKKSYRYEDDPIRLGMKALEQSRLADAQGLFQEAVENEHQVYRAHYGMAQIKVLEGDHTDAEPLYRMALIEKDQETGSPDYPEAHAGLGLVLLRLERLAEAKQEFEQALREKGSLWEAQYGMGRLALIEGNLSETEKFLEKGSKKKGIEEREDLYRYGMALLQMAQGDVLGAEKNALRAFHIYPNDPDYGTLVAEIYTERDAASLAIGVYEDVLQTPGLLVAAPVHHRLGRLYQGQERWDDAKNQYIEAVQIDSTYAPALKDLADLYFLAKRYEDSANGYLKYSQLRRDDAAGFLGFAESALNMKRYYIQAYEAATEAFKLDSTEVRTRLILARSAYQARERVRAAEIYDAISDSTLFDADDFVSMGQIAMDAKQFDRARANLTRAVELDSTLADAWFQLGILDLNQQLPDSAVVRFERTITLAPTNMGAWLNLGVARLQMQQNREAIAPLREATRLAPDFTAGHLYLANALVNSDSISAALGEYRVVREKEPQNVGALRGLAFCYIKRGDWGQAAATMREATTVDPNNPDNWVVYGQAQAGNGNNEGAIRALEKALELNPKHPNAQKLLDILHGAP